MTDMAAELRQRLDDDSPHRLAYYERMLNRIASEVGGNAKFHAERTAALIEEIEGLRKDMKDFAAEHLALVARVNRIADHLNKQNGKKP